MERTPSPSRRLHTPPAPLHGSKHDSYEPYSPRRSSRVARQREEHQQQSSSTRSRLSRNAREVTPTSSRKKSVARTSLQGFSPPSSPISPGNLRSTPSTRRARFVDGLNDSDSDHIAPTPARRFLTAMEPQGMLPTPSKTPRKRVLHEEEISTTARVLFTPRPATIEEAMPTPSKGRKNKKNLFSLDSFMEHEEEVDDIAIYTDSRERIPTADEDSDNPFVTKKGKGKAKAKTHGVSKSRKADPKAAKMQEAANREEGMIYMFRGKKIYRKFHDGPPSNASDGGPEFSGDEIRRGAGTEAHRPLTRSSIKPRTLFQEEIKQQRGRERHPTDTDEEAITDIEVPIATPSSRKKHGVSVTQQEATPPPTVRAKRHTPFDSWGRVKSSARESSSSRDSRKRSGDLLESTTDKRTRSEPSSAMSIDEF